MQYYKGNNFTPNQLQQRYNSAIADVDLSLNFEFNDRSITRDNPNDITDINYGNIKYGTIAIPFSMPSWLVAY